MNDIGFGIFCFGKNYYYRGTFEKIDKILEEGYPIYVLTESPEIFEKKYSLDRNRCFYVLGALYCKILFQLSNSKNLIQDFFLNNSLRFGVLLDFLSLIQTYPQA